MNDAGVIMQMMESLVITMQSIKTVSLIGDVIMVLALLAVYLISFSWQKKQIGRLEKEIGQLRTALETVTSDQL
jgi:hypothetical protein